MRLAASSLVIEGGVSSGNFAPSFCASGRLSSRTSVMTIFVAPKACAAARALRPARSWEVQTLRMRTSFGVPQNHIPQAERTLPLLSVP